MSIPVDWVLVGAVFQLLYCVVAVAVWATMSPIPRGEDILWDRQTDVYPDGLQARPGRPAPTSIPSAGQRYSG